MKKYRKKVGLYFFLFVLIHLGLGCSLTQTSYQREYNKIWREMVKSDAWQKALEHRAKDETLYASAEDDIILLEENDRIQPKVLFETEYQKLVSRAYFKIITEAEKADARITSEYRMVLEEEKQQTTAAQKHFKRKKESVFKKYEAHKAMLGGLKSWNIFSEYRSGDLDYFKREHRSEVERMLAGGESNAQIVNFLIYKMADLYHLDGQ